MWISVFKTYENRKKNYDDEKRRKTKKIHLNRGKIMFTFSKIIVCFQMDRFVCVNIIGRLIIMCALGN